ncbi:hypothetical protein D4764_14G0001000 [Takifugu flavidus]|uniref:Uncharacterized protein n=1 Tax=Takifugu flavidus TaxID=433684 RepID=A0A5C6P579_9TELE|nr:hypothetical protein D4764_14G0001000 [Takifugu flavidus]
MAEGALLSAVPIAKGPWRSSWSDIGIQPTQEQQPQIPRWPVPPGRVGREHAAALRLLAHWLTSLWIHEVFPLYSRGERFHFEYGVYLLNKNIAQARSGLDHLVYYSLKGLGMSRTRGIDSGSS